MWICRHQPIGWSVVPFRGSLLTTVVSVSWKFQVLFCPKNNKAKYITTSVPSLWLHVASWSFLGATFCLIKRPGEGRYNGGKGISQHVSEKRTEMQTKLQKSRHPVLYPTMVSLISPNWIVSFSVSHFTHFSKVDRTISDLPSLLGSCTWATPQVKKGHWDGKTGVSCMF